MADESMRPSIEPGDWLLVDPTVRRWPRLGSVVVFREPETDVLAIKRVARRPLQVVEGIEVTDPSSGERVVVSVRLGPEEAWLVGDSPVRSVDSRSYGPVNVDRLVARAWFRYAPLRRLGIIRGKEA